LKQLGADIKSEIGGGGENKRTGEEATEGREKGKKWENGLWGKKGSAKQVKKGGL